MDVEGLPLLVARDDPDIEKAATGCNSNSGLDPLPSSGASHCRFDLPAETDKLVRDLRVGSVLVCGKYPGLLELGSAICAVRVSSTGTKLRGRSLTAAFCLRG